MRGGSAGGIRCEDVGGEDNRGVQGRPLRSFRELDSLPQVEQNDTAEGERRGDVVV